eukprot:PLAT7020.22.p1 GENE.PLAT7020.22~~PLAT7020.22.p1  ORF type:complete len:2631 (+),score=1386.36 PLAT7020.22:2-7894(+)
MYADCATVLTAMTPVQVAAIRTGGAVDEMIRDLAEDWRAIIVSSTIGGEDARGAGLLMLTAAVDTGGAPAVVALCDCEPALPRQLVDTLEDRLSDQLRCSYFSLLTSMLACNPPLLAELLEQRLLLLLVPFVADSDGLEEADVRDSAEALLLAALAALAKDSAQLQLQAAAWLGTPELLSQLLELLDAELSSACQHAMLSLLFRTLRMQPQLAAAVCNERRATEDVQRLLLTGKPAALYILHTLQQDELLPHFVAAAADGDGLLLRVLLRFASRNAPAAAALSLLRKLVEANDSIAAALLSLADCNAQQLLLNVMSAWVGGGIAIAIASRGAGDYDDEDDSDDDDDDEDADDEGKDDDELSLDDGDDVDDCAESPPLEDCVFLLSKLSALPGATSAVAQLPACHILLASFMALDEESEQQLPLARALLRYMEAAAAEKAALASLLGGIMLCLQPLLARKQAWPMPTGLALLRALHSCLPSAGFPALSKTDRASLLAVCVHLLSADSEREAWRVALAILRLAPTSSKADAVALIHAQLPLQLARLLAAAELPAARVVQILSLALDCMCSHMMLASAFVERPLYSEEATYDAVLHDMAASMLHWLTGSRPLLEDGLAVGMRDFLVCLCISPAGRALLLTAVPDCLQLLIEALPGESAAVLHLLARLLCGSGGGDDKDSLLAKLTARDVLQLLTRLPGLADSGGSMAVRLQLLQTVACAAAADQLSAPPDGRHCLPAINWCLQLLRTATQPAGLALREEEAAAQSLQALLSIGERPSAAAALAAEAAEPPTVITAAVAALSGERLRLHVPLLRALSRLGAIEGQRMPVMQALVAVLLPVMQLDELDVQHELWALLHVLLQHQDKTNDLCAEVVISSAPVWLDSIERELARPLRTPAAIACVALCIEATATLLKVPATHTCALVVRLVQPAMTLLQDCVDVPVLTMLTLRLLKKLSHWDICRSALQQLMADVRHSMLGIAVSASRTHTSLLEPAFRGAGWLRRDVSSWTEDEVAVHIAENWVGVLCSLVAVPGFISDALWAAALQLGAAHPSSDFRLGKLLRAQLTVLLSDGASGPPPASQLSRLTELLIALLRRCQQREEGAVPSLYQSKQRRKHTELLASLLLQMADTICAAAQPTEEAAGADDALDVLGSSSSSFVSPSPRKQPRGLAPALSYCTPAAAQLLTAARLLINHLATPSATDLQSCRHAARAAVALLCSSCEALADACMDALPLEAALRLLRSLSGQSLLWAASEQLLLDSCRLLARMADGSHPQLWQPPAGVKQRRAAGQLLVLLATHARVAGRCAAMLAQASGADTVALVRTHSKLLPSLVRSDNRRAQALCVVVLAELAVMSKDDLPLRKLFQPGRERSLLGLLFGLEQRWPSCGRLVASILAMVVDDPRYWLRRQPESINRQLAQWAVSGEGSDGDDDDDDDNVDGGGASSSGGGRGSDKAGGTTGRLGHTVVSGKSDVDGNARLAERFLARCIQRTEWDYYAELQMLVAVYIDPLRDAARLGKPIIRLVDISTIMCASEGDYRSAITAHQQLRGRLSDGMQQETDSAHYLALRDVLAFYRRYLPRLQAARVALQLEAGNSRFRDFVARGQMLFAMMRTVHQALVLVQETYVEAGGSKPRTLQRYLQRVERVAIVTLRVVDGIDGVDGLLRFWATQSAELRRLGQLLLAAHEEGLPTQTSTAAGLQAAVIDLLDCRYAGLEWDEDVIPAVAQTGLLPLLRQLQDVDVGDVVGCLVELLSASVNAPRARLFQRMVRSMYELARLSSRQLQPLISSVWLLGEPGVLASCPALLRPTPIPLWDALCAPLSRLWLYAVYYQEVSRTATRNEMLSTLIRDFQRRDLRERRQLLNAAAAGSQRRAGDGTAAGEDDDDLLDSDSDSDSDDDYVDMTDEEDDDDERAVLPAGSLSALPEGSATPPTKLPVVAGPPQLRPASTTKTASTRARRRRSTRRHGLRGVLSRMKRKRRMVKLTSLLSAESLALLVTLWRTLSRADPMEIVVKDGAGGGGNSCLAGLRSVWTSLLDVFGQKQLVNVTSAERSRLLSMNGLLLPAIVMLLLLPIASATGTLFPIMPLGVTLVLVYWMVTVSFTVWRLRAFSPYTKVVYKRHTRYRPVWDYQTNWIAAAMLLVDWFQQVNVSFRDDRFGQVPRQTVQTVNLDFIGLAGVNVDIFEGSFWGSIAVVLLWVLLLRRVEGRMGKVDVSSGLLPSWSYLLTYVFPPLLSGALYVFVITTLVNALDCTYNSAGGGASLDVATNVACWTGGHLLKATLALISIGAYFPTATLVPFQVLYPQEELDIQFSTMLTMLSQLLKFTTLVATRFMTNTPVVPLLAALGMHISLLTLVVRVRCCSLNWVTTVKVFTYSFAGWSIVVNLLALAGLSADVAMSWAILGGGWAVITLLIGLWWRRRRKRLKLDMWEDVQRRWVVLIARQRCHARLMAAGADSDDDSELSSDEEDAHSGGEESKRDGDSIAPLRASKPRMGRRGGMSRIESLRLSKLRRITRGQQAARAASLRKARESVVAAGEAGGERSRLHIDTATDGDGALELRDLSPAPAGDGLLRLDSVGAAASRTATMKALWSAVPLPGVVGSDDEDDGEDVEDVDEEEEGMDGRGGEEEGKVDDE